MKKRYIQQGVGLGLFSVSATCFAFWLCFLSVLFGLIALQWIFIPPDLQVFPIPLNYAPYVGKELRHVPYMFRERPLDYDSSLAGEDAAIGFTDLSLNVSGLMQPRRLSHTRLFRTIHEMLGISPKAEQAISLERRQVDMLLHFDSYLSDYYSTAESMRGGGSRSWWQPPSLSPVLFEITFFDKQGRRGLDTVRAFFPPAPPAMIHEALKVLPSIAMDILFFYVPKRIRDGLVPGASQWSSEQLHVVDNYVLPDREAAWHLVKVKVMPPMPIKNLELAVRPRQPPVAHLFHRNSRILPLVIAVCCGVSAACVAGLVSAIVSSLCLMHLYKSAHN